MTRESVERSAFLRHIHEVVDRKHVYSMALRDVDRDSLAPLADVLHAVPSAAGQYMCDMEADVAMDDACQGSSMDDARVGAFRLV